MPKKLKGYELRGMLRSFIKEKALAEEDFSVYGMLKEAEIEAEIQRRLIAIRASICPSKTYKVVEYSGKDLKDSGMVL